MEIRIVIRPGKIVSLYAQNQEIDVLGIEMYFYGIQKTCALSFLGELGSFRVAKVSPNSNDFVKKSDILVWQNEDIYFLRKHGNQITTGTELSAAISWQIWTKKCTFCEKIFPKELILTRTY